MKSKTFKTLDEQIDILTKKGLVVEDVEATKTKDEKTDKC